MTSSLPSLLACAARGPHPVGVTSLELADPERPGRRLATDVWYPARPEGYADHEPADHPIGAPHEARTDAPPAAGLGPLPLVAFSHGNSGLRRQSTFLTSHLASWGLVVTAPDHAGNTFFEMVGITSEEERVRVHRQARSDRPRDLGAAIDAVASPGPDPARWPQVDASRVGVLGHSFGGWTALKMPARDPRVRAVCGLAPASEAFVGRRAFEPGELPFPHALPTLVVAALEDVLVDVDTSIRPLFARLGAPSLLVGLRDTDHFHFCDHLELLHGLHERSGKRPKQTRSTRSYPELLEEARTHRALRALVTLFFVGSLGSDLASLGGSDLASLDRSGLARLDDHLELLEARLDASAPARAAS